MVDAHLNLSGVPDASLTENAHKYTETARQSIGAILTAVESLSKARNDIRTVLYKSAQASLADQTESLIEQLIRATEKIESVQDVGMANIDEMAKRLSDYSSIDLQGILTKNSSKASAAEVVKELYDYYDGMTLLLEKHGIISKEDGMSYAPSILPTAVSMKMDEMFNSTTLLRSIIKDMILLGDRFRKESYIPLDLRREISEEAQKYNSTT